ncbi:PaaX family transcriptional regulator [Schumannella luteola]
MAVPGVPGVPGPAATPGAREVTPAFGVAGTAPRVTTRALAAAALVDELGMRTGSVPSLVLTIVGLYLRRSGGWMSTAALVRLAADAGAATALTRSAFTRLKQRGVLVAASRDGVAGYAFAKAAERMFERGDRRIFAPRRMVPGDDWCLISFSLPEQQRGVRAQLRRRLQGIGCGTVAPGLWIAPAFLADEVEEILDELAVRASTVLFFADDPRPAGSLADAVATWWDLPAIAARHQEFLRVLAGLPAESDPTAETALEMPLADDATATAPAPAPAPGPGSGSGPGSRFADAGPGVTEAGPGFAEAAAFRRYVVAVDAWRDIPYVDPGLPFELLPDDWPGRLSIPAFLELSERDADAASRHAARASAR